MENVPSGTSEDFVPCWAIHVINDYWQFVFATAWLDDFASVRSPAGTANWQHTERTQSQTTNTNSLPCKQTCNKKPLAKNMRLWFLFN